MLLLLLSYKYIYCEVDLDACTILRMFTVRVTGGQIVHKLLVFIIYPRTLRAMPVSLF